MRGGRISVIVYSLVACLGVLVTVNLLVAVHLVISRPERIQELRASRDLHSRNRTVHGLPADTIWGGPPNPIPHMGHYNCSDHCLDFLTPQDRVEYETCQKRQMTRPGHPEFARYPPGACHFIDGTNRPPVALVSFPGSGNSWVRGLLELATGICTGSIYCDAGLRAEAGFIGEGMRGGSVLVVKTHSWEYPVEWSQVNTTVRVAGSLDPRYGSAILLVRNPADVIVAEWQRKKAKSHRESVGIEFFDGEDWLMYVENCLRWWPELFIEWILGNTDRHTTHPVLVVRFEDVKADTVTTVRRMLDFLSVPYSEDNLKKRLEAGFELVHRTYPAGKIDPFTTRQRGRIKEMVKKTVAMLYKLNDGVTFGVEKYLDS